jgi:hypothetical protein
MNQSIRKVHKNRNKNTTDRQIVDAALTLHECSEYITKVLLRTNMNSYFRDRIVRLTQRLSKEAINLGNDLQSPNEAAFTTPQSTNVIARQLGLLD